MTGRFSPCCSSSQCPCTHPTRASPQHRRRTRNDTLVGVFSWSALFLCPTTCQAQNHTNEGVISCLASFLWPTTHANHETTTHWCRFMVGVFPTTFHSRRLRNNMQRACHFVVSIFSSPTTYAKHEITSLLVSFHAWILSYPLE